MKTWTKVLFRTIKIFILFTGCTILFYYGMILVSKEYENYHKYDEPDGEAIKVSANMMDDHYHWFDRLKLFYLNGE